MQYFLRYLIFTTPAKHEPSKLLFWNKYYIFMFKFLYRSVCLIYRVPTHLKSFQLVQYSLRYLRFTLPAKHEPLNLPFWNKYYIFLLKILYRSVCLIYTVLTHLKSFKLVQYSLRYLNFTLPAEHEIKKFD